jgi:hypothetical protein
MPGREVFQRLVFEAGPKDAALNGPIWARGECREANVAARPKPFGWQRPLNEINVIF